MTLAQKILVKMFPRGGVEMRMKEAIKANAAATVLLTEEIQKTVYDPERTRRLVVKKANGHPRTA